MDLDPHTSGESESKLESEAPPQQTEEKGPGFRRDSRTSSRSSGDVESWKSSGRVLYSQSTRRSMSQEVEPSDEDRSSFTALCCPCFYRENDDDPEPKMRIEARNRNYFYDRDGILRYESRGLEHDPDAELSVLRGLRSDSAWEAGEEMYIISSTWVESWVSFVRDRNCQPGPISNYLLLEAAEDGNVYEDSFFKKSLNPVEHYRVLNKRTWEHLHSLYGGTPVVSVKAPSAERIEKENLDQFSFTWLVDVDLNRDASLEFVDVEEPVGAV